MGLIFIVLIVLIIVAILPRWPYSRDWGPYPAGLLGIVLLILLLLLLFGAIPRGY